MLNIQIQNEEETLFTVDLSHRWTEKELRDHISSQTLWEEEVHWSPLRSLGVRGVITHNLFKELIRKWDRDCYISCLSGAFLRECFWLGKAIDTDIRAAEAWHKADFGTWFEFEKNYLGRYYDECGYEDLYGEWGAKTPLKDVEIMDELLEHYTGNLEDFLRTHIELREFDDCWFMPKKTDK